MTRHSIRKRLRYRIDNSLAKGVTVVLLWVGIALLVLVIAVGTAMWTFGIGPNDQPVGYIENLWESLTRSLDPGTFGNDEGRYFRLAGLIITIGGLLAVSLVIGLVSNAVDTRLDQLRRGRSLVVERDHTLVLGFSSKLPIVVRELLEANGSTADHAVVVLTPEDKVDLEDQLRRQLRRDNHTRLVVRRGEPSSVHDLAQVRPDLAKAIVILRPDAGSGDAEAVRVALAVHQSRVGEERVIPVVVEVEEPNTADALQQALPSEVVSVLTRDIIGRIAAQTSRAGGLGTIYQDLLDFDGDEIYLAPVPPYLVHRPFWASLLAAEHCTVIGIMTPEGEAELCPDMEQLLQSEDRLILITADDSSVSFTDPSSNLSGQSDFLLRSKRDSLEHAVERTLLIGWNRYAQRVLLELDRHALAGSELHVLVDRDAPEGFNSSMLEALQNYKFNVSFGTITDANEIADCLQRARFDHILILCAHDGLSSVDADAHSLLALMHVRNCINRSPGSQSARLNLVSEMLQPESVELAQIAQPDDFIVSQRLVSLYIAQIAECPERKSAIDQLLEPGGAQLSLVQLQDYVSDASCSFADLVTAAAQCGDIAIGWRTPKLHTGLAGGIQLNPTKSATISVDQEVQAIVISRR